MIDDGDTCSWCGEKLKRKKGFLAWIFCEVYCPNCDKNDK